jgi:hypothetical protein
MLSWISQHGHDATAPPGIFTEEEKRFRHPYSVVNVINCDSYPSFKVSANRQKLLHEIQESLCRGQAVKLTPWPIDEAQVFEWTEDGFARLTGGAASEELSLSAEVEWQSALKCYFFHASS